MTDEQLAEIEAFAESLKPGEKYNPRNDVVARYRDDVPRLIATIRVLREFAREALPVLDAYQHMHTRALRAEAKWESRDD